MAGDFSTMPNPFTWDESAKFAHIIDGYGVAGGVEQCQEITNNAADNEPDPNDRAGSALTLWIALFGEHRRHRHSGYPPGPQLGCTWTRCARSLAGGSETWTKPNASACAPLLPSIPDTR
jgi:hypothetical protein